MAVVAYKMSLSVEYHELKFSVHFQMKNQHKTALLDAERREDFVDFNLPQKKKEKKSCITTLCKYLASHFLN